MAVDWIRPLGQLWPVLISVAMFFAAIGIHSFSQDSLIYTKLCYQKFNDDSLCNNRAFTKSHPDLEVQANTWGIYTTIVTIIPAILFTVIFSSYCDLIAHKLPIIISITGCFFLEVWYSICSYYPRWPMFTILFGNLIYGFSGSYALVIMSMFSYISLKCSEKFRPMYLALGEAMVSIGMLSASFVSGPIADDPHLGLPANFLLSTGLLFVSGLVIIFAMKDLYKEGHETRKLREIFSFLRIKDATTSMFKKRHGYERAIAHTSFLVFFLHFTAVAGSSAFGYLYYTKELGMTQTSYTVMRGVIMSCSTLTPLLLIPLITKFKIYPLTAIIVVIALQGVGYIILTAFKSYAGIWVGQIIQAGSAIVMALTRNIQATVFHKKDIGKVFAYEGFLQIVLTYVSLTAMKAIYSESVNLGWPNAAFTVVAFTEVLAMVGVIVLHYFLTKHKPYEELSAIVDKDSIEANGNLTNHVDVDVSE